MTTITSRLDYVARASITFDPPLEVEQYGRKAFVHQASARSIGPSYIALRGKGFYAKKDGTEGKQVADLYSLRLSDLPVAVQDRLAVMLAAELSRVEDISREPWEVTL